MDLYLAKFIDGGRPGLLGLNVDPEESWMMTAGGGGGTIGGGPGGGGRPGGGPKEQNECNFATRKYLLKYCKADRKKMKKLRTYYNYKSYQNEIFSQPAVR